jgi:hypothetical protein
MPLWMPRKPLNGPPVTSIGVPGANAARFVCGASLDSLTIPSGSARLLSPSMRW